MPRLALALALLGAGCAVRPGTLQRTRRHARPVGEVASNIERHDYAGSAACAPCHRDLFARWAQSPMHRMTRIPEQAQIAAPFQGEELHFKEDRVRMERAADGGRFMRLFSTERGEQLYRVTRVIGGHHREDFAGLQVTSTAAGAAVVGDARLERVLPASFMRGSGRWRYKGYSVMVGERPSMRVGGVWNRTCIFCHNTVPYLSDLFGELAGPGTPPYQGELVDPRLPASRRWPVEVTDPERLRTAIAEELRHLGARAEPTAAEAVRLTRTRFSGAHLVEVGIGCESCHGGSRAHVENYNLSPTFEVKSRFLRVRAPELTAEDARAQRINRTCARCHQVLFSRYPYTWEGGLRAQDPGGSNINSGEARDLLLGACASKLSCVRCHDPHAPDDSARRRELETAAGDEVCLACHAPLRGAEALRAHSHHAPEGAGARCLACHMPRKNMSLDNRLTRYHRIGSPTERTRVEGDRPLECALCHVGQSVETLVATMERWWGKSYDRSALRRLYGDLGADVMMATLALGKPHEQAVALTVLGEARRSEAGPLVARQLTHGLPILRYYAERALEAITGAPSSVDLNRPVQEIAQAAAAWLQRSGLGEASVAPAVPSASGGSDEDDP